MINDLLYKCCCSVKHKIHISQEKILGKKSKRYIVLSTRNINLTAILLSRNKTTKHKIVKGKALTFCGKPLDDSIKLNNIVKV